MAEECKGFLVLREFFNGISLLSMKQRGQLLTALYADMGEGEMPKTDRLVQAVLQMMLPSVHRFQNAAEKKAETARANGSRGGRPVKRSDRQEAVQAACESSAAPCEDTAASENPMPSCEYEAASESPVTYSECADAHENPMGYQMHSRNPMGTYQTNPSQTKRNEMNFGIPPIHTKVCIPPEGESTQREGVDRAIHTPSRRGKAVPPTVDEVAAYCRERGSSVDPQRFCDHYGAQGWQLGNGRPVRDWKAALRNWEARDRAGAAAPSSDSRNMSCAAASPRSRYMSPAEELHESNRRAMEEALRILAAEEAQEAEEQA